MKNYLVPLVIAAAFVLGSVVNSSGLQEEKPKKNVLVEGQKWEITRVFAVDSKDKFEECQKLAGEGWEPVCVDARYFYLKRPKQ